MISDLSLNQKKTTTTFERAKALFDAYCSGKPEATPGESGEAAETRSAYSYCSTAHQSCLRSQVKATAEVPGGYNRSLDPGKCIFHEAPRANIVRWRPNKTQGQKKKKMSSKEMEIWSFRVKCYVCNACTPIYSIISQRDKNKIFH